MSKTIDLEQIPVIKELVQEEIEKKTTPIEDEIEDIKKNGDRVHQFLLYDWDDTLIGVVAVPMGYDPRPYINKYVKENLIHPDLRNQTAEQLASRERTDNYRGEYPHTGPDENDPLRTGGADTVEDGGDYPLTNHLEYCFMGKDIDPDYPYVSGWTEVTPENMADTFTALTTQNDGTVAASEFGPAPTEEGATAPRIVQYDWTDVASLTTPMITHLKACYRKGVNNSKDTDGSAHLRYTADNVNCRTDGSIWYIGVGFKRVNAFGNGVELQRGGKHLLVCINDYAYNEYIDVSGDDNVYYEFKVLYHQIYNYKRIRYQLKGGSYYSGSSRSAEITIIINSTDGVVYTYAMGHILTTAYEYALQAKSTGIAYRKVTETYNNQWTNAVLWFGVQIAKSATSTAITNISGATNIRYAQCAVVELIGQKLERNEDYTELTWWQLQYAVLNKTSKEKNVEYVDSATAEAWIRENKPILAERYDAMVPQEETTE